MKGQAEMCVVVNRRSCGEVKNALYIGRGSIWGNPFVIGKDGDRKAVIEKYRQHLWKRKDLLDRLPELVGKTLVCYCKPLDCHGDVLVRAVAWQQGLPR